jgi:hypothetical protein
MGDYIDLDVIGAVEGTDKSSSVSFGWDYLRHYQALLEPWRHQPINFIEIGVMGGASLGVWKAYFTQATIIGIDINPWCARFTDGRVVVEIGSQENPEFLYNVCTKYPPTIVIDDGSHMAHHVVYSFEHIFPMLLPGGIYIVEDLALHFGARAAGFAGDKSVSAPDYFQTLAQRQMAREASSDAWGSEKYIQESVDTMTFFGGGVALRKKQPRDMQAATAFAEQYLSRISPTPAHHLRYAQYLLRHNVSLDRAERAALDALAAKPGDLQALSILADILDRAGKVDEAVATLRRTIDLYPTDFGSWHRLSRIERARQRNLEANEALARAASLRPEAFNLHRELSDALEAEGDLPGALAAAQRAANAAASGPGRDGLQRRVDSLRARVGAAA